MGQESGIAAGRDFMGQAAPPQQERGGQADLRLVRRAGNSMFGAERASDKSETQAPDCRDMIADCNTLYCVRGFLVSNQEACIFLTFFNDERQEVCPTASLAGPWATAKNLRHPSFGRFCEKVLSPFERVWEDSQGAHTSS